MCVNKHVTVVLVEIFIVFLNFKSPKKESDHESPQEEHLLSGINDDRSVYISLSRDRKHTEFCSSDQHFICFPALMQFHTKNQTRSSGEDQRVSSRL